MLNVIRMEINRLFRSKSLYIALGICAGAVMLFVMALSALMNFAADFSDMTVSGGDFVSAGDLSESLAVSAADVPSGGSSAPESWPVTFCAPIVSGLCLLFVVIYTASFVHAFYIDGFSKNVIACVKYRYYFQISKTVCVAAISAVFLAASSIVAILTAAIRIKEFTIGNIGLYFAFMWGEFLLLTAVGLLSAFLTELTGGKATAIVYILLAMTNLVGGILSILDSKLSQWLHIKVTFSDLLPSLYHSSFSVSNENGTFNGGSFAHAVMLSLVFIAVYNAAGSYLITKRDVK